MALHHGLRWLDILPRPRARAKLTQPVRVGLKNEPVALSSAVAVDVDLLLPLDVTITTPSEN